MSTADEDVFNAIWIEGCENIKVVNPSFEGTGTTTNKIKLEGTGVSITNSQLITIDSRQVTICEDAQEHITPMNVLLEMDFQPFILMNIQPDILPCTLLLTPKLSIVTAMGLFWTERYSSTVEEAKTVV